MSSGWVADLGNIEDGVRTFYDTQGWVVDDGMSGEDRAYRQFSLAYEAYHADVTNRLLRCFDGLDGTLLIAGGGDLPGSHLKIAEAFHRLVIADISAVAIEVSRDKLGDGPTYLHASILDLPLADDDVDAVLCAHVIYHIDAREQELAVRELLRVARPGGRVVIVYRNTEGVPARLHRLRHRVGRLVRRRREPGKTAALPDLYFHAHPLSWWSRFDDVAHVEISPWDFMSSDEERALFVTAGMARAGYALVHQFEQHWPRAAARWWSYPIVTLTKHG